MLASIFAIDPRRDGAVRDAYITNPEIITCPLETLQVPTMLIHAKDDPLASHDAAAVASQRIPDATLVSLESGGHLQLGQADQVRTEIETFLATPTSA